MSLVLIAAVSENGVIGKEGELPWHLPQDLKRFKELTLDHPVVMGSVTFDSIVSRLNKPQPGRHNIVLDEKKDFSEHGVSTARSIDEALRIAGTEKDVYIIGGASVYSQSIGIADRLEITRVHQVIEGDAFFPNIDPLTWYVTQTETGKDFSFFTYGRR